ncbi:subunit of RNA polymerase III (C) [Scheffersomyces stipitis CBS 6054]|uniref:DNA-directed RNA polymerase III subunit RPC3 n=1 Tax=Scheffersomyces stipitis (strain ATCC 58785 / CBS 6054 / NBRC 10063 / NRRL Y-11545) TaxID=322104 RepID=RPC3_PICST|nr:subunit of RNA polymerase III (C) [Scheffersomyces stipitis CBS 6054]A3LQX9.1 RecName: Full=DNA-directed RNA polymerase III subunit RPC3; Short=RNA polymerase III subunit C3 [Scheffersomyces stipitis CBS 6054]ABN65635.1 subunit of RNA polymerase III (C) [Scheffersomyces stipitis CBS 6054]
MDIGDLPEASKTQSPKSYLYTSIARNHLGDVAALIISCLISYGRLTATDISHRTKIPVKKVKSALVSLIQMNCIFYWRESGSKQVFYSFNETGILVFLHSGDIISHVTTHYGEDSAEIVQNILVNGHIRIEDYVNNIDDEEKKLDIQTLFFRLFTDRWIVRLQPFNFNPVDDIWNQLYQETLKNTPRTSTTSEVKRVAEAKEKTKTKFINLIESGQSPKDLYLTQDGIKRLNPALVVTFNLSRFQKHLRTTALVSLAKSRVGLLSARIYESALKLVEASSPDLTHPFLQISGLINDPEEARFFVNSIENKLVDEKKTVFNVRDLGRLLPHDLDLRNSILTYNFVKHNLTPKKRSASNGDDERPTKKIKTEDSDDIAESLESNGTVQIESNGNGNSISLIQHHLKLLSSGSGAQLLIEITPGSYTVPYASLLKYLKQYNFETLVKTTLGPNSFRILRCLKSLKIGDEKTISNSVLLKEKTVRNEIYKLLKANMLEVQEVPRSADRAASKTFYLFRHKEFYSYEFLCNSLIFSMAEILSNIQAFREDHKILLEKCEREDVKGHEEELLLESELKTLKSLQTRQVSNTVRFNRIKSLYEIYQ